MVKSKNTINKLKWTKQYYQNLINTLIKFGYYETEIEAKQSVILHENLHDEGPAITHCGNYEILGLEILFYDLNKIISLPKMSNDFFVEPENPECVRIYDV